MISKVKGNYIESNANFIINLATCEGIEGSEVAKEFPHVSKECNKYLLYCEKNGIDPLGAIQFIPVDTWALVTVDTIRNNIVMAYDKNYNYIVNCFASIEYGKIKKQAIESCLLLVKQMILDNFHELSKYGKIKVVIPYWLGLQSFYNWNYVENIIKNIFNERTADIDVQIME